MKMDVGMALEPAVVFGLVGIEIIENDMNFFFVVVAVILRCDGGRWIETFDFSILVKSRQEHRYQPLRIYNPTFLTGNYQ